MKLEMAIKNATRRLLRSNNARTYYVSDMWGERKSYVVEMERDRSGDPEWANWLEITTWGFDYEGISIPQNRGELIAAKCRAQMGIGDSRVNQILLRYCLDILHRECEIG
jgi:hypothetical protein